MKKTTAKKLVLAKETVRELDGSAMPEVAAGTYQSGDLTYYCPSYRVACKYPPTW